MKQKYFATLTSHGESVVAYAIANNAQLNVTHMAVGDGDGQDVIPSQSQTALVNEVYRNNINQISLNPQNPQQVIFELLIPAEVGGFWTREMGVFDANGQLIAVANCPASYKPQLSSGSGKVQILRMILQINTSENVMLLMDNSVVYAKYTDFKKLSDDFYHHKDDVFSHMSNIATLPYLMEKMKSNESVSIAFFGDSTTDGNSTTGWVKNDVDSSGNATGIINHSTNGGKNAYPTRLQALLRSFYKNEQINCYNAGYSGKRLDNGWARENINKAILDNQFYKDCDAIVVAFGLNDIARSENVISDYIRETEELIKLIYSVGKLPILMASDAHWRSVAKNSSGYENSEIVYLNNIKKGLADKYKIPYINMHDLFRDLISSSSEYQWSLVQPDGLHSNDLGHQIKASILAKYFIGDNNLFVIKDNSQVIEWHDSRANYPLSNRYGYSHIVNDVKVQNNYNLPPSSYNMGEILIDAWVWCENEDATLIYRALSASGTDSIINLDNLPIIKIESLSNLNNIKTYPLPAGGLNQHITNTFDRAVRLQYLNAGLNRITFSAPKENLNRNFYGGYFEINTDWQAVKDNVFFYGDSANGDNVIMPKLQLNALSSYGNIVYSNRSDNNTGKRFFIAPKEDKFGNNVADFGIRGRTTKIIFEGKIGVNTGLVALAGASYRDIGNIITQEGAIFIYRPVADSTEIRLYSYGDEGSFRLLSTGNVSSISVWDDLKLSIEFKLSLEGLLSINIVEINSQSTIITYNPIRNDIHPPVSGTVGGAFINHGEANTTYTLEINKLLIQYY